MAMGLQSAANQLQAMGRAPDTMLAHISPDEAKFIDQIQGGRRTNPQTGLPEYSMFGNILKAVARAAGAVGGFMVGGPAGAAAGAGAATKLTGGSWKEALGSAALSGVGSFGAQGLTGGGWSPFSTPGSAVAGSTLTNAGLQTPGFGTQFANVAKSAPGIAAGIGGLSQPLEHPAAAAPLQMPGGSSIHLGDVQPQPRTFNPYPGDPTKFAEPGSGGQGWQFYTPLNPIPKYGTPTDALPGYAGGGVVMGLQGPNLGPRGFRGGGIQPPGQPGGALTMQAPGIGVHTPQLQQAAMMGYQLAAKGGRIGHGVAPMSPAAQAGSIRGPGTGTSDSIPAMLSDGEHVVDAATTSLAGQGSNDAGQRVMENIKQEIRAQAGQKNPKTPPSPVGMMVARAKRRAGVK